MKVADSVHGGLGQPVAKLGKGFFSGKDFQPVDLAFAPVSLLYRAIKNAHRRCPYVATGTIAFDVRNNGIIRDLQLAPAVCNGAASSGQRNSIVRRWHGPSTDKIHSQSKLITLTSQRTWRNAVTYVCDVCHIASSWSHRANHAK